MKGAGAATAERRLYRARKARCARGWFRGPLRESVRDAVLGRAAETGGFNRRYLEHLATPTNRRARLQRPLWTL